ncbi:MAG: hypothetical protein IPP31_14295 [Chitinophagaceae bacterium]|nr:hypothetical protein [Chitinophagaceae bacterium]
MTKDRKVFFLYAFLVTLFILTGIIVKEVLHSKVGIYSVSRIYDVMEFSFLSYFFSLHIANKRLRTVLPYAIIPFAIFCLYDFITTKVPSFAFIPLVIECLFFLVIIIYIFYEKMQYSIDEPIFVTSIFWIAVGFIVYCSGNFFLFLYSKNSYIDSSFKLQYSIIYSTVTILKNIMLCIGVSRKKEKIKENAMFPLKYDSDFLFPSKNK